MQEDLAKIAAPQAKPQAHARPLFRIGDLARSTRFSRQTIHNYTVMGLIQEVAWTEGGHRLYDETAFHRLLRISQLRKDKTLAQIRQILATEYRENMTNNTS
ncbi:MAG: MerR family transcriptional regulator [Sedimentisphaerales bacterium]|nr:MerR family transcriptional regulator [Sedimentisphaerales bacterium]